MSAMVVYLWNKSFLEKIKSEAEINEGIYQLVKSRYTRKTLKYINVNPNEKVGSFILESDPVDKIGTTASGIAGTKLANKINNPDSSQPKDFYKDKIGVAIEGASATYMYTMANPEIVIFVGDTAIPVLDNLFLGGTHLRLTYLK